MQPLRLFSVQCAPSCQPQWQGGERGDRAHPNALAFPPNIAMHTMPMPLRSHTRETASEHNPQQCQLPRYSCLPCLALNGAAVARMLYVP